MSAENPDNKFWNGQLATVMQELNAVTTGLKTEDSARRLAKYGYNTATDVSHTPLYLQFLLRFKNPLIILLMVASVLSAMTGDVASFVIILVMIMLSVTLDFFQEIQAEKSVDALRSSVAIQADVMRDGTIISIPAKEIVPGDIVRLSPGCLVPADGRIIACKDFYINQAILTGESFPLEKNAKDLATPTSDITEALNSVFMGTSVISGSGDILIISTGKKTRLGQLAGTLAHLRPPTAFERGVQDFGMMILRLAVVMVLFVLLVNLSLHRPILESFLFALALAVGLTPELLPMLMTITFSRGAIRMAKQKVIVKHLPAMHNLGAMDVLCTDKTGTLTEAKISLIKSINTSWEESDRVFTIAYLNSYFESGIKAPLDEAILAYKQPDISKWTKIDEVPFDFERRRISVLVSSVDKNLLIVKGAPEDILKLCNSYEASDGNIKPLDAVKKSECVATFEKLGDEGLRVLGIAFRAEVPSLTTVTITDETDLVFAGFATFIDPPKPGAAEALKELADAGISVKILSGDNERVTHHVCEMLGFVEGDIITGDALSKMSDEALSASIDGIKAFCRVTPQQKSKVIAILKSRGHIVGFMGDGINDAAALHISDVGISVDSATDVAKEAADIILLERNLSVIHSGVIEGRRAVANTEKYIRMGSSSNFGNMFSMAGASLLLPFLPMLPIQILLNNLLYDFSQTTIPFDNVDDETLTKPVHWDIKRIMRFMAIMGPVSSIFDFITFYVLLKLFHASEELFHTGWFVESLATQVLIIFAIRTRKILFKSKIHPALAAMAIVIVLIAIIIPFTPLGTWFGLTPLPKVFFLFLAGAIVAYFTLVELVKICFRKWI